MKIFHAVEHIFLKLSIIPGLGFLYEYVHELEGRKTQKEQVLSKYQSYVHALRGVGTDVSHLKHGHDGHGEEGHGHGGQGHGGHHDNVHSAAKRAPQKHVAAHEEELNDEHEDEDFDEFESYML